MIMGLLKRNFNLMRVKTRTQRFWLFRTIILVFVLVQMGGDALFSSANAQEVVQLERIEIAQNKTLFDLLFGPKDPPPPPPTQPTPTTTRTQSAPRAPAQPRVVAPEIIEKDERATRLMVFGDSLAIDLAKAFQRAYAEDPKLVIVGKGIGSSGFVRDDYFDWNEAIEEEIAADSFDLAVMIIGTNDKQPIGPSRPLSDEWKVKYLERLNNFLSQLGAANKPVIWVGLPPMRASSYSAAMSEIAAVHRLASISSGIDYVDIYERFVGDDGQYSSHGPNLNGEDVRMRKSDGIHFSAAGSDKLVFFVNQALRNFYRGGAINVAVEDPLMGTDAMLMVRPPYQGNGQVRLLEVAGAVLPISNEPDRALSLVLSVPRGNDQIAHAFDLDLLIKAPIGRVDAFGVGVDPSSVDEDSEIDDQLNTN